MVDGDADGEGAAPAEGAANETPGDGPVLDIPDANA
jgi:hypothetical protein